MNKRVYAHRNLNQLKANPDKSRYVYSYGNVSGNIGRGKLIGHEFEGMVLTDVVPNCQTKSLQRIANGEHRSISAWLIGTLTTTRPSTKQKLRRFSIDPPRGDLVYKWSDTREPVDFGRDGLAMVWLRPDGCYAVVSA